MRTLPLPSLALLLLPLAVVGIGCSGDSDDTTTSDGGANSTVGGASTGTTSPGDQSAQGGGASGGAGNSSTDGTAVGGGSGASTSTAFSLPVAADPWAPSSACVQQAAALLASMDLAAKAGQMVQADTASAGTSAVGGYHLGSILSGGNSDPASGDLPAAWVSMVQGYLDAGVSMGLPILYGIDAIHGHNNVTDAVVFPHNIGLGCTRDPALLEEIGQVTARELRGTGIHWTFAPVLAAGRDERWGRTYETYAETPELAAELGLSLIRGLQGTSLSASTSVLACAKHFAGDGATDGGEDRGNSSLSEAEFKALAIDQYQPAINAGVGSIMVSYSSFNGLKMSGNQTLLTETLKGTMGFKGFLISDWAAVQELGNDGAVSNPAPTRAAIATAINAGLDMIMEPVRFATVAQYIEELSGTAIPQARIDDAVTRILQVKCEMGLFASGYSTTADSTLTAAIGSASHREVARRAVRESLVLLKNDNAVLPIDTSTAKLLVAGTAANSAAKQCGGWTVDWQGLGTKYAEAGSTTTTTLLTGIQNAVGTANVTYAIDGATAETGFTHAIVVVGESPYAEGDGDESNLALANVSADDAAALETVAALNVPTVVVVVSGRPLIITELLSEAEAWVAAWLPGSEGDGVADILFGDYSPTGQLSHSWPSTMAQVPINVGDTDYATDPPLFAYGFGLTYE